MVHVAILRHVRPGQEAQFEQKIGQFFRTAESWPGAGGSYLIKPTPGAATREYGILRSFESEEAMRSFYGSATFARWEAEVSPLVEGEARRRELHGLEAFFDAPLPPARWKMAMLTWLGVTPAVALFSELVPPLLGPQPALVYLAIVNVFVVASLTWIIMPGLARIFRGWLRPGRTP